MKNKILFLINMFFAVVSSNAQDYCLNDQETLESVYGDCTNSLVYANVEYAKFKVANTTGELNPIMNTSNIDFNFIYNTYWNAYENQNSGSLVNNGRMVLYVYYYNIPWWDVNNNNHQRVCSKTLILQGDKKVLNSMSANYCPGDVVDVGNNITPLGGSISSTASSLTNGILTLPYDNTEQGSQSITYDITLSGCSLSKQFVYNVNEKPNIQWNQQIQTGQILDTDPAINLTTYASTTTPNTTITYSGTGVVTPMYNPNLSGGGQHTIVGIATNNFGCTDTVQQTVNVTMDPGVPPQVALDWVWGSGALSVWGYNIMHVCDGQDIRFRLYEYLPGTYYVTSGADPTLAGMDSLICSYESNGILTSIGTFGLTDEVFYTIPKTYATRKDILYTQIKSSLGVVGPAMPSPLYINTASPNILEDTICFDNAVNMEFNYSNSGFYYNDYNGVLLDTSTYEYDSVLMEKSRNYVWKDINGNLLDTSYTYTHTFTTNKVTQVIREEFTRLPNGGASSLNQIANEQVCRVIDTVNIVQEPSASFTFSGSNVLQSGAIVQFFNTSTLDDYAIFNFDHGSLDYSTEVFGDTIWQYMNDYGYYDISVTAWDNYGCSSDTTAISVIQVIDWTSVEELKNITELVAYPNPVVENLTVNLTTEKPINYTFTVLDLNGKLVYSEQWNMQTTEETKIFNLAALSKGLYQILLQSAEGQQTSAKIIKQ